MSDYAGRGADDNRGNRSRLGGLRPVHPGEQRYHAASQHDIERHDQENSRFWAVGRNQGTCVAISGRTIRGSLTPCTADTAASPITAKTPGGS